MSAHASSFGACPECRAAIPAAGLLIEYETTDGPAMYAECRACESVVAPE